MNGNVSTNEPAWLPLDPTFSTTALHTGYRPKDHPHAPVVPCISLSTTFEQDAPAQHRGYEYTRSGNPTRSVLESTLAALDKAKYGYVFASGLAATTVIASLLETGDGLIAIDDVYGGTGRLFRQVAKTAKLDLDFVDFQNVNVLKDHLKPNTKLVWIETPTNPTLKVVDIAGCVEIIRAFNKDIIIAVDNTFLSAYFQRPLTLGADLCVTSLTKYGNGHSDVLMGSITTNSEDLKTRIGFLQNALGAVPSPFDCYLMLRSLRTLHVRMPLHYKNGMAVAKFLESHPKVEKVLHPGLKSHPQHQLALKQSAGHSGLISFYLKPGSCSTKMLQELKIFALAESLGGYESLAEVPHSMTHASVPPALREILGINERLVRLSVGLEAEQDLINDLDQALNAC